MKAQHQFWMLGSSSLPINLPANLQHQQIKMREDRQEYKPIEMFHSFLLCCALSFSIGSSKGAWKFAGAGVLVGG
jgi:hypothetical protein